MYRLWYEVWLQVQKPTAAICLHSPEAEEQLARQNENELLEKDEANNTVQTEKWKHSQLAREQIHTRMLFSRTGSLQVISTWC